MILRGVKLIPPLKYNDDAFAYCAILTFYFQETFEFSEDELAWSANPSQHLYRSNSSSNVKTHQSIAPQRSQTVTGGGY